MIKMPFRFDPLLLERFFGAPDLAAEHPLSL